MSPRNRNLSSDAIAAIGNHPSVWFATCARILTKDQRIVQLHGQYAPNEYQLKILQAYEWALASGIPCRILALKPRQKGSSTVTSAIVYHHCRRYRSRAIQIADRYRNSDNLFAMTKRYAEHDDYPWATDWHATETSATLLMNGEEWSRIDKDTAENPRAGRSGTLQVLHVSEAAHFPNDGVKSADKTMLSMLNSLADVPNSVGIVETTANGASGWFYEQWKGAVTLEDFMAGRRGNGWIKIFSPWFEFQDSATKVSAGEVADIQATLTEREQAGIELHGWTWEQIAWRRWTISQKCGGSEDMFDQEYPEDENRAYLTSGRPRFPIQAITHLRQMLLPPRVGNLHWQRDNQTVSWEQSPSGWAQIWQEPKAGCRYLLWCDTSTGREQTKDRKDPDRHSILVLRQGYSDPDGTLHNAAIVARVRPPCLDDWHVLEEKVIALCLYYGKCLIGVEVPMGLTLLEGLRRAGMPLFRRRQINGNGGAVTEKLGFQTTGASKPLIVASLSRALVEQTLDVHDAHIVDELTSFVIHDDGSEAAANGSHDDDVMSLAMGIHHISSATQYKNPVVRKSLPADFHKWKPLHR